MTQDESSERFEESGALLTGHFRLSSGLHSERYLQCALVLQTPDTAEKLCAALAAKAKADENVGRIDLVIAPALGGVIVAHEVARALGARALFTERDEKSHDFAARLSDRTGRAGFRYRGRGDYRGSTREVMDVVRAYGDRSRRRFTD